MDYTINRKLKVIENVESVTMTLTPAEFLALDTLRYWYLGGRNPLEDSMRRIHKELFGRFLYKNKPPRVNVKWSLITEGVEG